MTNIFISLFLTATLSSCQNHSDQPLTDNNNSIQQPEIKNMDFDILDAYKLTFGKTFLFGNYDTFIGDIGLPNKVTVFKTDFSINSKTDLDKAVFTAKNPAIVTLHYPGIDMWYTYENSIVPSTIDFRKTEKSVTYGETIFDKNYTIEQFKKQFPNSATLSFEMPESFFEMVTKEKGVEFKHFMLKRKTKDDPTAEPLLEFTFENGKLIFVMFANFG